MLCLWKAESDEHERIGWAEGSVRDQLYRHALACSYSFSAGLLIAKQNSSVHVETASATLFDSAPAISHRYSFALV